MDSTSCLISEICGWICVFISSGIREGTIEYLKVDDYTNIRFEEEKIVAGRLVVYRGEPEQYVTFITP
ncbi:MAG: hypothetical protein ACJ71H_00005, partial [Nitrososphaeraceae archaeon]